MKIKNVDLFLGNFKPKVRKIVRVVPAVAIAATMAMTPLTAHAAVPNEEILGDLQVQEDRTDIKREDAYQMAEYFDGYDNYGCVTISLEDLEKAIEMSDLLNATMPPEWDNVNTTRNEILNLDVYSLYTEYQYNPDYFARAHQGERSAIDGYLTFGTHTVASLIKEELAHLITSLLHEQGYQVTNYPVVMVTENEVSCVVGINGCVQKFILHGEKIEDVKRLCTGLDYHYNTAMASIDGSSPYYENTFAYNGVRSTNGESVWLSLGNSEIKGEIREAIALIRVIEDRRTLEMVTDDPLGYRTISAEEALALRNMGYNIPDLNNVRVQDIYVNTVPSLEYNK
jgi:hypothetical protein